MREIKVRLFVPTESGFTEFADSSAEKQREFADECIKRMGESMNAESVLEVFRAERRVSRQV